MMKAKPVNALWRRLVDFVEKFRGRVGTQRKAALVRMYLERLPDNPYDGHTLDPRLSQVRRLVPPKTKAAPEARVAIEPTIGHMKSEHRLERNRLKGTIGGTSNALFSTTAMNFQKLLGFFFALLAAPLRSARAAAGRPNLVGNRVKRLSRTDEVLNE